MTTFVDVTAQAAELAAVSWRCLLAKMKGPRVPVDYLTTARAYLTEAGMLGGPLTPRQRRRLEGLHRLYVLRLEEAIGEPNPPATVLVELRRYLQAQRVTDEAPTVPELGSAALPFKAPESRQ
jgi:hypothetical protein